jgi:hypothetical protein
VLLGSQRAPFARRFLTNWNINVTGVGPRRRVADRSFASLILLSTTDEALASEDSRWNRILAQELDPFVANFYFIDAEGDQLLPIFLILGGAAKHYHNLAACIAVAG